MAEYESRFRVYYDDTDCLGVVYHTNYLKYCERARTDLTRAAGFELARLNEEGAIVVVARLDAKFRQAARLGEELVVKTRFCVVSPMRCRYLHRIERDGQLIFEANVDVACVDHNHKLRKFPEELRAVAEPLPATAPLR